MSNDNLHNRSGSQGDGSTSNSSGNQCSNRYGGGHASDQRGSGDGSPCVSQGGSASPCDGQGSANTTSQCSVNTLLSTRVLVVGSGVAGTCAAVRAAETLSEHERAGTATHSTHELTNTHVVLACTGPVFSGSSFFKGTWGLGLIAPSNTNDEEDLAQTIIRIGCGVANERLVRSFVAGIRPAIAQLEQWGVTLKRATERAGNQREYIPCFDHKHRAWYGIERVPYVQAMGERLTQAGVHTRSGWELLDIDVHAHIATFFVAEQGSDQGSEQPHFAHVRYDALVLCTGGASSLYSRHLTTSDCSATVQGLAAQRGCNLVNMAFLQFMPGIISPVQNVVFNEKTFRYMQLDAATTACLGGKQKAQQLLALRSTYGPFTSRLESCAIDFAIQSAGANGLALTPCFDNASNLPEFVQTYQTWLEQSAGVSATTPLRIAVYAHAHNGGIAIDAHAATSVPSIFAAGECTGGMHGADRLGGLSSANGLVFGMRAGENAAACALNAAHERERESAHASNASAPATQNTSNACTPYQQTWEHYVSHNAPRIEHELRALMDTSCMIVRNRTTLEQTLSRMNELVRELATSSVETNNATLAAQTRTTHLRLLTACEMVKDMLQQPCRCGSHYCC